MRPLEVVVHVGYGRSVRPQQLVQLLVGVVFLHHSVSGGIAKKVEQWLNVGQAVPVAVVVFPGLVEGRVVFQSPQVPQSSPSEHGKSITNGKLKISRVRHNNV